jgi:hypothetical protein
MDHLGIAGPEESEVVRHLEDGRMIEAVRAYRKHTGVSLLEAKQAVDRIAVAATMPGSNAWRRTPAREAQGPRHDCDLVTD